MTISPAMMGESAFEFSVNDYSWQLTVTMFDDHHHSGDDNGDDDYSWQLTVTMFDDHHHGGDDNGDDDYLWQLTVTMYFH